MSKLHERAAVRSAFARIQADLDYLALTMNTDDWATFMAELERDVTVRSEQAAGAAGWRWAQAKRGSVRRTFRPRR